MPETKNIDVSDNNNKEKNTPNIIFTIPSIKITNQKGNKSRTVFRQIETTNNKPIVKYYNVIISLGLS